MLPGTLAEALAGTLAALLLSLTSSMVPDMNDAPHALALDVRHVDGGLEVQLIGQSPRALQVSYELDVTGQSTSRHRGKTTIAAGSRAVLSTIRVSAGAEWCVRLLAEDDGGEPYEIREGNCTAAS